MKSPAGTQAPGLFLIFRAISPIFVQIKAGGRQL
jgi:hypothetical protein